MTSLPHSTTRMVFSRVIDRMLEHVDIHPESGVGDLLDLLENHQRETDSADDKSHVEWLGRFIGDASSKWLQWGTSLFSETDPIVLKTFLLNVGYESEYFGKDLARQLRQQHNQDIPRFLSFDPISPDGTDSLSFKTMDRLVTEGKELGIFCYYLPSIRSAESKKDIFRLCLKHKECEFIAHTDGSSVDDELCEGTLNVCNLVLTVIFTHEDDPAAFAALDKLHDHRLLYGSAIRYGRGSCEPVISDRFLHSLIDKGSRYVRYCLSVPSEGETKSEERDKVANRIRTMVEDMHDDLPIIPFDLMNDYQFPKGCGGWGKIHCHIDSSGEVRPCPFIDYATANIERQSLLEALDQPLFRDFRNSGISRRGCPLIDQREQLSRFLAPYGNRN